MSIQAGEKMPSGAFGVMTEAGPGAISTDDLFGGKKVVLVSVPGAFTPTCSMNHLPGFVEHADELLGKGVDTIACMAVNDVFVMEASRRLASSRICLRAAASASAICSLRTMSELITLIH